MNKLKLIIINSLLLSVSCVTAESTDFFEGFSGFKGDNRSEIEMSDWTCEYCLIPEKWEYQLDTNFGLADDNHYQNRNYSDLPDTSQLFFSGNIKMQEEDGRYWKTSFQNIGLDSGALQSAYGLQGQYGIKFDYQKIPVRKFDQLLTPFINLGANSLNLGNDWIKSDDGRNFSNLQLFTGFKLGTDWERLGLSFNILSDNNFDFNTSFSRLEKDGTKELSVTQMLSATYLPLPVHQTTEDFRASLGYTSDNWYASFAVNVSNFSNLVNGVTYDYPFTSLVPGGETGQLSTEPDNLAVTLSLNAHYFYSKKSSMKIRLLRSELTQDEAFLPYTTNQNLLAGLPQANLNGKVSTQDITLQVNHRFNSDWSFRAKYRNRERDNQTEQIIFQPVVTDIYTASQVMNTPYDYSKESFDAELDYRLYSNQLLSLSFKSAQKDRNFQTVHKTTDEGFIAKYRATLFDDLMLTVKVEDMERSSTGATLVDFLNVDENPLMQRFNVADRELDKVNFQLIYSFINNFSTSISGSHAEQNYLNTQIGLTNNVQDNLNLDFNWQFNKNVKMSFFLQKEEIETMMAGSNAFSSPDWFANNFDDVSSYGFNLGIRKMLDEKLDLFVNFNRSDADTAITVTRFSANALLPKINSLWSQAELKLNYLYSEDLTFSFSYQHQKFESNDFTIDGVVPGSLSNLLTFGALSNNYDVNFVLFTASYKF